MHNELKIWIGFHLLNIKNLTLKPGIGWIICRNKAVMLIVNSVLCSRIVYFELQERTAGLIVEMLKVAIRQQTMSRN